MMRHLFGVFALTAATPSFAADRTICVLIDVDFVDSDLGGAEDYYAANGAKVARGIQIKLTDNTTNTTWLQYADADGANAGCATFTGLTIGGGRTFEVRPQARTSVNGNVVHVRNSANGNVFANTVAAATPLLGNPTYTITPARADIWNTVSVAGQALFRNTGGLTGMDIDMFMEDNSGQLQNLPTGCDPSGCLDGDNLYLSEERTTNKFELAYYLGWVVINHMSPPSFDKSADDTHCGPGIGGMRLDTLEYQATAYAEGYANWYAASAFNRTDEADCSFNYWRSANWDQLDTCYADHEVDAHHTISCAEKPGQVPLPELVPAKNYRAYCAKRAPGFTLPSGTSVGFDTVRFWQEMVSGGKLMRSQVGLSLAEAFSKSTYTASPFTTLRDAANTIAGMVVGEFEGDAGDHGLH